MEYNAHEQAANRAAAGLRAQQAAQRAQAGLQQRQQQQQQVPDPNVWEADDATSQMPSWWQQEQQQLHGHSPGAQHQQPSQAPWQTQLLQNQPNMGQQPAWWQPPSQPQPVQQLQQQHQQAAWQSLQQEQSWHLPPQPQKQQQPQQARPRSGFRSGFLNAPSETPAARRKREAMEAQQRKAAAEAAQRQRQELEWQRQEAERLKQEEQEWRRLNALGLQALQACGHRDKTRAQAALAKLAEPGNRSWPEAATPHTVMMLYWRVAVELGSEKLLQQLHKTKPRSSQWHQDAPLQLATILTASLQTDEYPPGHTVLDEVICRGRLGVLSLELSKYPQALKKLSRPPVLLAVESGAPAAMVDFLAGKVRNGRGTDANEADEAGNTPLTYLLEQCANESSTPPLFLLEQLAAVMKHMAQPDSTFKAQGEPRMTPVYYATVHIKSAEVLRTVLKSLKATLDKAKVEVAINRPVKGLTPLYKAVDNTGHEAVAMLLQAGADAFAACYVKGDATSALHLAVQRGYLRCVEAMLSSSAVKDRRRALLNTATDHRSYTALHLAVEAGHADIAHLLIRHEANVHVRTPPAHDAQSGPPPPLLLAVRQESEDALGPAAQILDGLLGNWRANDTLRSMHADMEAEDVELMTAWLRRHHMITLKPFLKNFSISQDHLHKLVGLAGIDNAIWQKLFASGANPNARDERGNFLLHKAVEGAHRRVIAVLLECGANAAARNKAGKTALHLAVRHPIGKERNRLVEAVLLAASSPATLVTAVDDDGNTPLDLAVNPSVKATLEKYGVAGARDAFEEERQRAAARTSVKRQAELAAVVDEQSWSDEEWHGPGPKPLVRPGATELQKHARLNNMLTSRIPDVLTHMNLRLTQERQADGTTASHAEMAALSRVVASATAAHGIQNGGAHAEAELAQAAAAAAVDPEDADEAVAAAQLEDSDAERMLDGLLWEFTITKEAREEWAALPPVYKKMVCNKLRRIGEGCWLQDGSTDWLSADSKAGCDGLDLWRSKWSKGGRIIFEVALDWSEEKQEYRDMLRLWVITLNHDKYEASIEKIQESYRKSRGVANKLRLEVVPGSGGTGHAGERLPKLYRTPGSGTEGPASPSKRRARVKEVAKELRDHLPPASAGKDSYTLLKFYSISTLLVSSVLKGMKESEVDFKFKVSPAEQRIIELRPDPPSSIILLGRSGTGKTTCAVFRMFGRWLYAHNKGEPDNMVFLTASATLREQVALSFRKLQTASLGPEAAAATAAAVAAAELHTFKSVPPAVFPLFLTTKQYLHMLDGTLADPFFPRLQNGMLKHNVEDDFDPDGMGVALNLSMNYEDDELDEMLDEDDEVGELSGGLASVALAATRKELTYQHFVEMMWTKITNGEERRALKASLVFQEVVSYIKGAAEAISSEGGQLTLSQYLEVGRKRAPNFSSDMRRRVYPVFLKYETLKVKQRRYDAMDLVASIYRRLQRDGYTGTPLHSVYRDEVQDFAQAELLTDLRVVADPNSLFYCGDTCQTIARGIGFRFADIRTLFFEESQRRKDIGGVHDAMPVAVPALEHLKVNYRTHSGIMNVASTIVDLLQRFFPQHMDRLEREKAFFVGPGPLLLSSLVDDDLAILLSGSDRKESQVEFGAHQVILMRTTDSYDTLPALLKDSNALTMTVPQSKGLEFDDVFLVNFFSDSPAAAEWRVLMAYLEELEAMDARGEALPGDRGLVDVEPDAREAQGALRPLPFDAVRHPILSEELKHLYTAVTRAKNNVILFDRDSEKRAPFFHLLRRLGLVRVVKSLMGDGADASKFGLSQARSSKEEWMARGDNLMDNLRYEFAARAYNQAGDTVRGAAAAGRHAYQRAREVAGDSLRHKHYLEAAFDLLTAATKAQQAAIPVPALEQRKWLAIAARALVQAGWVEAGADLSMQLHDFAFARKAFSRAGNFKQGANCALRAAAELQAAGNDAEAGRWLQRAARQYRSARMFDECLALLQQHPEVAEALPTNEVNDMAGIAVTAAMNRGDRKAALIAAERISDPQQRENIMRRYGFFKQLAEAVGDPAEAAELLASQGALAAAMRRLVQGHPDPAAMPRQSRIRLHGYALRHAQDSVAAGDGNGARWVLENARQLWAGSAADAAARQQRHLALGQLSLAQAHSYTAATAAADVQAAMHQKAVQPATSAVAYFVKAFNPCGIALALAALAAGLHHCDSSKLKTFGAAAMDIRDPGGAKELVRLPAISKVLAVQAQLRQLVLKLVRPKGMSSEERALLTAAEAVYGVSELALSTGDLPTRADNALLMSALDAAGCTSHIAALKAAADSGVMRVVVSAADARAAVVYDLLNSMATLAKFLGTAVEAGMPQLGEEGPTSVGTAGQEAQQMIELLLDAFLFVSRARDMLADSKALLLHAAPQAASRLQVALQREQDVLGAGVARDAFPICLDTMSMKTVVFDFRRFAGKRAVQDERFIAIAEAMLLRFASLSPVQRLQEQNAAHLLWRTLFVLLRKSDRSVKLKQKWPKAMAMLCADVRSDQLSGYELRGATGRPEHNITLLHRAQQFGFKRNKLRTGVDAVLAYLERCRISEGAGATQPLALEVYTGLLEMVGGVLALALTPHCTLLPQPYVATLLHSPIIGQDDARTQMRLSEVSDLWSGESHRVLLSLVRRTAALLRSLASELAPDANPRPGLADGLLRQLRGEPAAGKAGAWQAMQRTVAARLALLGCMLAAALAVHSAVVYGPQGGVEELRWGLVQTLAGLPGLSDKALQAAVVRMSKATVLGGAIVALQLAGNAFGTHVIEVQAKAERQFTGAFSPAAPGCCFSEEQAHKLLQSGTRAQMWAAAEALQLPQLRDLSVAGAQDAAKAEEEDRREVAAAVVQQAWRALLAHRAQLRALARLRAASRHHGHFQRRFKRLFLDKLAAVRARIAERRGREAAAVMEAERRAAAAASAEDRLKWVLDRLHAPILDAALCPVCPPRSVAGAPPGSPQGAVSPQGGHTAGSSPRDGGSPRGGFGLAPSAMAFVPHKTLDSHKEALYTFETYHMLFDHMLLPELRRNNELVSKVEEKLASVGADAELEHSGHATQQRLATAAAALLAVMEAVEGGRRWGACQETVQPADELKAACDAADGWLKAATDSATWTSLGGRKVVSAANAAFRAEEKRAVESDDDQDDDVDDDLADDFAMAAALGKKQQPRRGSATGGGSRQPRGGGGSNRQQNNTGGGRNRRGRGAFTY